MARFIKLKSLAVLILLCGSAWVLNANAQVSSDVPSTSDDNILKTIEKTYNVKAGGNLTVVSEFGAIDIQTAEQDKVETVITFSPANYVIQGDGNIVINQSGDIRINNNVVTINGVKVKSDAKLDLKVQEAIEDFEATFEHKGSDVRINGKFKQGRKHWRKELNRLKILFQVTVPQQYNVDLETSSDGISVADLDGDVRAKTSAGSLRFGRIKGPVWGRTSAGSVKLTSCDSAVDVKTSSGSVEVGDVAGDVRAQTSGGSLRFGEIQGSIWGKTSSGSIRVTRCNGNTEVQTSSGSIKLENLAGTVNARTSSGSIRASLTDQPDGECNLHTSAGSITLTLIPDIAINLDAETRAGRVSTDFAVTSVIQGRIPKNRLRGSINGGGPLLKLRTSAGSIRLQKATN